MLFPHLLYWILYFSYSLQAESLFFKKSHSPGMWSDGSSNVLSRYIKFVRSLIEFVHILCANPIFLESLSRNSIQALLGFSYKIKTSECWFIEIIFFTAVSDFSRDASKFFLNEATHLAGNGSSSISILFSIFCIPSFLRAGSWRRRGYTVGGYTVYHHRTRLHKIGYTRGLFLGQIAYLTSFLSINQKYWLFLKKSMRFYKLC